MTGQAASPARVHYVGCPSCASPLAFPDGRRTAACPACGGRVLLLVGDGAGRERVLPRIDGAAAVSRVRSAWAKAPVDGELPRVARFDAPELVLVPFWEVEALQAGVLVRSLGEKNVRSGHVVRGIDGRAHFVDDEGRPIAEHEYYKARVVDQKDTRIVLRTDVRNGPAGGPASWRLEAIDVKALRDDPDVRFVPWDFDDAAREGAVLPIRTSASDAVTSGGAVATGHDRLAAEVRFVHVPVWVVRCRSGLRTWTYVVDGVHGRVLAGRAPETPRRGALTAAFVAMFLGFPLGKIAASLASEGPGAIATAVSVLGSGAGPFVLIGVAAWFLLPFSVAWNEFRYRGEVDFGPGGARVVKLARPRTTWVERAMAAVFDALTKWIEHGQAERDRRFPW